MDDMSKDMEEDKSEKVEQTWYHEGPDSLRVAREWIANFSIPKAKERLQKLKLEAEMPEKTRMAAQQEVQKRVKQFDVMASQIADTRPVSYCQFSPQGEMLATASWSGVCKLWNVSDCSLMRTLRGHGTHVMAPTCVPWPRSVRISEQSDTFHSLHTPDQLAVANISPWGLNWQYETGLVSAIWLAITSNCFTLFCTSCCAAILVFSGISASNFNFCNLSLALGMEKLAIHSLATLRESGPS